MDKCSTLTTIFGRFLWYYIGHLGEELKLSDKGSIFATLKPTVAGLGGALGFSCELVLHDFACSDDSIVHGD